MSSRHLFGKLSRETQIGDSEIRQIRTNCQQGHIDEQAPAVDGWSSLSSRTLQNTLERACQNYPTQRQESCGIYVSTPIRYYLSPIPEGEGVNFPALLPAALGHNGLWLPVKALRERDTCAGSWESVPWHWNFV